MTEKQTFAVILGIIAFGEAVADWFARNAECIMAICLGSFFILLTCSIVKSNSIDKKKL